MLNVTNLAGFGGGAASGAYSGPIIADSSHTGKSDGSSIDVGSGAGRTAIFSVTWRHSSTAAPTLTLGGVGLTEAANIASESSGGEYVGCTIFIGDVSSVSGSQTLNLSTRETSRIAGIIALGVQSETPEDSDTAKNLVSDTSISIGSLAVSSGGFAIACGASFDHTDTLAISNITGQDTGNTGSTSGEDHAFTHEWDEDPGTISLTLTASSSGFLAGASACWR